MLRRGEDRVLEGEGRALRSRVERRKQRQHDLDNSVVVEAAGFAGTNSLGVPQQLGGGL